METINSQQFKLTNKKNKYLTFIDNNAKMKTKLYSNNQSISYNAQGELIINDKCLTKKGEKEVEFDVCKKDKNQSWDLDNKKIYPSSSPDHCLFSQNEKIEINKCSDDENTIFNIEDDDTDRTSDYALKKYMGKTIVLVDSDNPWYLNKDTTVPVDFHKSLITTPKTYRNAADFGDYKNPEFEHFKQPSKKKSRDNKAKNKNKDIDSISQNQIIFLLLVMVALLFIYKKSLVSFSKKYIS
jgi:hypothetical protein